MAYGLELILIIRPNGQPSKAYNYELTVTSSSARETIYEAFPATRPAETADHHVFVDPEIFCDASIQSDGTPFDFIEDTFLKSQLAEIKDIITGAKAENCQIETFVGLY